jgi:hypothetical protein
MSIKTVMSESVSALAYHILQVHSAQRTEYEVRLYRKPITFLLFLSLAETWSRGAAESASLDILG